MQPIHHRHRIRRTGSSSRSADRDGDVVVATAIHISSVKLYSSASQNSISSWMRNDSWHKFYEPRRDSVPSRSRQSNAKPSVSHWQFDNWHSFHFFFRTISFYLSIRRNITHTHTHTQTQTEQKANFMATELFSIHNATRYSKQWQPEIISFGTCDTWSEHDCMWKWHILRERTPLTTTTQL